jgi:hypothetical protein
MEDSEKNNHGVSRRSLLISMSLSAVIVLAAYIGIRFVLYKSDSVHYHANFSLFVQGQREEFKSFAFYEEVAACATDQKNNPKDRVHMHDQNSQLVHIHAPGATWGHLMANLGITLGDGVLELYNAQVYQNSGGEKLTFWLNGQPVQSINNRLIGSEDRLLINFGNDDQSTLQQRYDSIASDAGEYNGKYDPGSCSGGHQLTFWQRLKKAAWF